MKKHLLLAVLALALPLALSATSILGPVVNVPVPQGAPLGAQRSGNGPTYDCPAGSIMSGYYGEYQGYVPSDTSAGGWATNPWLTITSLHCQSTTASLGPVATVSVPQGAPLGGQARSGKGPAYDCPSGSIMSGYVGENQGYVPSDTSAGGWATNPWVTITALHCQSTTASLGPVTTVSVPQGAPLGAQRSGNGPTYDCPAGSIMSGYYGEYQSYVPSDTSAGGSATYPWLTITSLHCRTISDTTTTPPPPPPPPPTSRSCSITFDQNPIQQGGATTMHWTSTGGSLFYIDSAGYVPASGSTQVAPTQTTDYSGYVGDVSNGAKTVYLTTGSSWIVPSDWNSANNSIEVIGGGGGGGGYVYGWYGTIGSGGGGGAYSKVSNVTFAPGSAVSYSIGQGGSGAVTGGGCGGGAAYQSYGRGNQGSGGGDTYFGGTSCAGSLACAKGGGGGLFQSGGAGGRAGQGIGGVRYSGGDGFGAAPIPPDETGYTTNNYGGAGGAAGPHGDGQGGSDNVSGAGDAGFGGAPGIPGCPSTSGGTGSEWGTAHGSGGGAGAGHPCNYGGTGYDGATGGLYGGGGGSAGDNSFCSWAGGTGAQGIIVITYTPTGSTSTPPTATCSATLTVNTNTQCTSGSCSCSLGGPVCQGDGTLRDSCGNVTQCPLGCSATTNACNTCPSGTVYDPVSSSCASSCRSGYHAVHGICVLDATCTDYYYCSGNNLVHQYLDNTTSQCTTSSASCGNLQCTNGACTRPQNPQILSWRVRPTLVRTGTQVSVSWSSAHVSSCTVTGSNGDSWTGLTSSQQSAPITAQTIFTLNCLGLPGAALSSISTSTTVNLVPSFQQY
jgi:hypothetical protein